MNKLKYKVGDGVLIRAEIKRADESDADLPYLIEVEWARDINNGWVSEDEIYSIAPPFDIGEEIFVSDGKNPDFWETGLFVAYYPEDSSPYLIISERGFYLRFRYARKIQPKEPEKFVTDENGKKYKLVEVES